MWWAALGVALAITATAAQAQALRVGVAAPLTGSSALLGQQVSAGAQKAAAALDVQVDVVDDACTPEGGAAAARSFVEAKVGVVTGFLCTEAIEAALPILTAAGIPTIATGVRTESLTDRRPKTGWLVVRYAPRADAEVAAAARILSKLWRNEPFAIIDDGTIASRDLAEGFRLAVESDGLRAVFTDTFRPQLDNQIGLVGRLRKAGATRVFAAGDRADLAIIGRDAAVLGADLVIAGGEVLRAVTEGPDLVEGTLMVGIPDWASVADEAVIQSFRGDRIEPEGYVLPAYASVQIAAQTMTLAAENGTKAMDILALEQFQTALGAVSFDAKGERTDSPHRLYRYENGSFTETD